MRKLFNRELTNNKQANDNKDSSLSWIIASLGQVAHFTSVVIRNVLATSGWVRSAHTAPYAKSAHNSLVKAIAFTLAETLVVMGIIGVVAALTIPNLNQSTGDREKVAKVKKVYANLTDAFGRATAVYGPIDEWFKADGTSATAKSDRFKNRISEFLKLSKDCGVDSVGCFFNGDYKTLEGKSVEFLSDDLPKVLLADGTALEFNINNNDCDIGVGLMIPPLVGGGPSKPQFIVTNFCGVINVDIDGMKGANTTGKDAFEFLITSEGITPAGTSEDVWGFEGNYSLDKNCFKNGRYCTGWIIETGNMDYLKATNGSCSLSWKKTTCK